MSIAGGLLARMKAVSAVTDIVGTGSSARIHAMHLPQKPTLEAVVFQRISTPIVVHAFGADPGLTEERWQVSAWGNTFLEAKTLAAAVKTALSRYSGTSDSTVFQDILHDGGADFDEDPINENTPRVFRSQNDYLVWYEE